MIELRAAKDRGVANFGWLNSHHTFSFGSYHDDKHMGHSALRVINDDTVAPGAGFGTHGHRDMEIISFVTQGVIAHKDSMGNVQRLPKGEFQLMSAGSGVTHSEFNASDTEVLKFLQIWVVPDSHGGQSQGLTPVITPTGENGTLKIRQQATISQLYLQANTQAKLVFAQGRKGYVHIVQGSLNLNGQTLDAGDGAKLADIRELTAINSADIALVALVFDLP
jgi:redox-sensitive bicupin YhaK (pirin superfamily)